jgi:hypothetical protein
MNMSLINLCNQESYVGTEMRKLYNAWKDETDESVSNPWMEPHWFTIYVPHPDQQYENVSLEEGLTKGYDINVKPIADRSQVPYSLPNSGHFVVLLKQKGVDSDFGVGATGIFVRPLEVLSLDIVVDPNKPEYRPLLVKHPVIRDYPDGWDKKLKLFMTQEIRAEDLPNVVGHVDQTLNQDYCPPSWNEVFLSVNGFVGF